MHGSAEDDGEANVRSADVAYRRSDRRSARAGERACKRQPSRIPPKKVVAPSADATREPGPAGPVLDDQQRWAGQSADTVKQTRRVVTIKDRHRWRCPATGELTAAGSRSASGVASEIACEEMSNERALVASSPGRWGTKGAPTTLKERRLRTTSGRECDWPARESNTRHAVDRTARAEASAESNAAMRTRRAPPRQMTRPFRPVRLISSSAAASAAARARPSLEAESTPPPIAE
eukprot:scaffold7741_cov114-Isochrysis_galbana.AAC.14